jgi:hypothetical protein
VKSAKALKGATVCVQSGTTTELNLTDYSRANNLQLKPVVFEKQEAVQDRRLLLRPLPGVHHRCVGPGFGAQQRGAKAR